MAGTSENRSLIFEKVSAILVEETAIDRQSIGLETDIARDLGIAGDDADDLFEKFDDAFDIDWNGLNLGVHFGSEGFGLPFPWQLRDSHHWYRVQPCKVSDVVEAAASGRWKGTDLVPLSKERRAALYLLSSLQWLVLSSALGFGAVGVVTKLLE